MKSRAEGDAADVLLEPERRGGSSRVYLEVLTGLRGAAALWVALWHAWTMSGKPLYLLDLGWFQCDLTPLIRTGWAGVDIFFVLSGFVLGLPFCQAGLGQRDRVPTGDYLRRRLLRVLPAYWVQLLILTLVAMWAGNPPLWSELFWQAGMLHNLFVDQARQLNPVYWTLPIEFNFYLVLPLLAALVPPRHWLWLWLGAFLLVLCYRYLVFWQLLAGADVQAKVWWLNQLPGRLDQFVAGMLAAYCYTSWRARGLALRPLGLRLAGWLVLGGLLLLAWAIHWLQPIGSDNPLGQTYWGGHWLLFFWHSATGLLTAALVFLLAWSDGGWWRILTSRVMVYLGVISYSLYLWHYPLMQWLQRQRLPALTGIDPWLDMVLWSAPPVLLVSSLSYWLIERPALRLRHRL